MYPTDTADFFGVNHYSSRMAVYGDPVLEKTPRIEELKLYGVHDPNWETFSGVQIMKVSRFYNSLTHSYARARVRTTHTHTHIIEFEHYV